MEQPLGGRGKALAVGLRLRLRLVPFPHGGDRTGEGDCIQEGGDPSRPQVITSQISWQKIA